IVRATADDPGATARQDQDTHPAAPGGSGEVATAGTLTVGYRYKVGDPHPEADPETHPVRPDPDPDTDPHATNHNANSDNERLT
ncbi:MAG: hypothetical protein K0R62_6463, partial [Nonomuraea muscovyensis]|nr:hypothetical protein [Nonomuraea muscovyensis]